MGSVAVFSVSEMSWLVELVRPQPYSLALVPAAYEAVSPDVVIRIGVALTATGRVSTARSLSMVFALYDGWFHCRQTPVAVPPCRSVLPESSVVASWEVPVMTAPLACQS